MHTLSHNELMIHVDSTYDFSAEKNQQLIRERCISFDEIIAALGDGKLLDVLEHPNSEKYAHQKMYVVDINGYIYLIPFVRQSENRVFLKTIFPSRKLTKFYLRNRKV